MAQGRALFLLINAAPEKRPTTTFRGTAYILQRMEKVELDVL